MASRLLNGSGDFGFTAADAIDYGCAGRGAFDPFSEGSSDESRPICECDRALVEKLQNASPNYTNYDASNCVKAENTVPGRSECCNWNTYYYASYNSEKFCCGVDGVKKVGNC